VNDPLYANGIDFGDVLIICGKVVFAFALLLIQVLLFIWFLRKVISDMQNRIGPNYAGPFGILQTLADGIKLFFKEQLIPETADRPVFKLAPYLAVLPAFLAFCVVPWGGTIRIFGRETYMQVAEVPMGVLVVLAMSGIAVYGAMLAGWASGSKYPLLGGVRASAQVISYEAAMSLSVLAAVIQTNSLSMHAFVVQQAWDSDGIKSLRSWGVLTALIVPFVVFMLAALAETNQPPFDLVEAEQELVGGFHTEYSGIRFAIFQMSEFISLITMSAIAITLFLGGPAGPNFGLRGNWAALLSLVWFIVKIWIFLFANVWLRASVPRLRYDQLMDLGWRWLIPVSLLWLGVVSVKRVAQLENWHVTLAVFLAIIGAFLVYAFVAACMPRRDTIPARPGEVVQR
jgi:NADH-quinone oxidoreductase subunit H